MQTLLKMFGLLGISISLSGCQLFAPTRVVFLDSRSDVVRLGPDVRGRVYVMQDGEWKLTKRTRLPEGWYAGPGPVKVD